MRISRLGDPVQASVLDHVEQGPRLGGYTDLPNPCESIQGHSLEKRTVYISDAVYKAVWDCASPSLRDAMDLAYLMGQRPADALKMTEHDIIDGHLIVTQEKTKQPLRIQIAGELATLLARIQVRKAGARCKPQLFWSINRASV